MAIAFAATCANQNNTMTTTKLRVRVGAQVFSASLYDNPASVRFQAMLPLALDMSELNGNEKFFRLATDLPANAVNPGTIEAGDLMLWGSNTVVLFYEDLATAYRYTKLGKVEDAAGLAAALGTGDVKVGFEPVRSGEEPRR